MTKVCPKCHCIKSVSNFHKSKQFNDGLRPWCKACVSNYNKSRYKNKSDEIRNKVNEYRMANAQAVKIRKKVWATANAEIINIRVQNRNFGKKGGQISFNIRQVLRLEQGNKCSGCLRSLSEHGDHLGHVFPLSLGGEHSDSNMQLLCPLCNIRKSNKHPMKWMSEFTLPQNPQISSKTSASSLTLSFM